MVGVIVYIMTLIGRKRMDFKFGFGWIFVSICIIILGIFPNLLVAISNLLGIASPVNMLFLFGFLLSIFIIFSLSMTISELTDKVKKLSQELAILRRDTYDSLNRVANGEKPHKSDNRRNNNNYRKSGNKYNKSNNVKKDGDDTFSSDSNGGKALNAGKESNSGKGSNAGKESNGGKGLNAGKGSNAGKDNKSTSGTDSKSIKNNQGDYKNNKNRNNKSNYNKKTNTNNKKNSNYNSGNRNKNNASEE